MPHDKIEPFPTSADMRRRTLAIKKAILDRHMTSDPLTENRIWQLRQMNRDEHYRRLARLRSPCLRVANIIILAFVLAAMFAGWLVWSH